MGLVVSIILIAAGAIMRYAVSATTGDDAAAPRP